MAKVSSAHKAVEAALADEEADVLSAMEASVPLQSLFNTYYKQMLDGGTLAPEARRQAMRVLSRLRKATIAIEAFQQELGAMLRLSYGWGIGDIIGERSGERMYLIVEVHGSIPMGLVVSKTGSPRYCVGRKIYPVLEPAIFRKLAQDTQAASAFVQSRQDPRARQISWLGADVSASITSALGRKKP